MTRIKTKKKPLARKRLLDSAYKLFSSHGISRIGIDNIIAESGCAKSSLYNHFNSKEDLAIAFLNQREEIWLRNWLESEVNQRCNNPKEKLLAIFDVFDGWFHRDDFEGCSFINVLLESDPGSPLHSAAASHLATIRTLIHSFAEEAGIADAEDFTQIWHMLMKGSIIAAGEGNRRAARQARRAAQLILDGWEGTSR